MKYQLWTLRILRSCTHATWLHITTYMCGFYQCIINNNFKYSCIYAYKLTLYLSQSSIKIFKMYFKSNKCNNVHQITLKIEYSPPAKKVYIRGPLALRMHYQIHRLRTKKNWAQKLMTSQHTEIRLNIVFVFTSVFEIFTGDTCKLLREHCPSKETIDFWDGVNKCGSDDRIKCHSKVSYLYFRVFMFYFGLTIYTYIFTYPIIYYE